MRKVIGIGETILDIIFAGDQPKKAVPGGSVFNGLVSLGRLGTPVVLISELGQDHIGEYICQFMKENHIDTHYVDRYPKGKSPLSLAFLNERSDAEYTFYHDYPVMRLEVPLPPIMKDDLFVFGSFYAVNPLLRSKVVEFLEHAKKSEALIYYDPNFRTAHVHEAVRLHSTFIENFEYADIIRGSDEDFMNIFEESDMQRVYDNNLRFYCPYLITTHADKGVNLYTPSFQKHFDVPAISALSTIGAGDNFNAGIQQGLLKHNIRKEDLPQLTPEMWEAIIRCGIDLASEVCQSYDNYISVDFATNYNNS